MIIEARRPSPLLSLTDILRHRELLYMLTTRDIQVRYRQAIIGLTWAIAQPLVSLMLFLTLFAWLRTTPASDPNQYTVSALCGLCCWQFMANVMQQSTSSLVLNRNLITKVYFPRALIPLATVGCGLFDFLMSSILMAGFMLWHQVNPGWNVAWLLLWLPLLIITASGLAFWLSALNALYRDFAFVVPFVVQIGMLATPVVYESSQVVPPEWRSWYAINPLSGIFEGLRASFLNANPQPWHLSAISAASAITIFVTGLLFFARVERTISDRI